MGRTTKPCPACGTVKSARKADGVCSDCRNLLLEAKAWREQIAAEPGEFVAVVEQAHWFPHIPCSDGADRAFHALILKLVRCIGENIPHSAVPRDYWDDRRDMIEGQQQSRAPIWKLPAGAAGVIQGLHDSVRAIAKAAFEKGRERGCGLLQGLATGEYSVQEFNELSGRP